LRANGRAVAFDLALEKDGVISLLKGGYDEAHSRYGPGIVLLHDLLEDAFARGIKEVDLLGSSERYKLPWADATRNRSRVSAFSPTPRGTAEFGLRRLETFARAAAQSMRRRRTDRRGR